MKALPCPGCGAPITVKQGIASTKCSFCELEVKPDFNTAPEFQGLEEKQLKKLERRAFDSLERGLLSKSFVQFSALAELSESNLDEKYIEFQALTYSIKLKIFLQEEYDQKRGSSLLNIQNEVKYASSSEPNFSYTRIDATLINIIEDLEDKCDSLEKGIAIELGAKSFILIQDELMNYIPDAVNFMAIDCNSYDEEVYGEYGDYTNVYALEEPILLGLKLQSEMFCMLFKFLEIIDIGENENNAPLSYQTYSFAQSMGFGSFDTSVFTSFTRMHPKNSYSVSDISSDETVIEFYEGYKRLEEKIQPYINKEEKKLELEIKRKKEEEKKEEERKRIEELQKEEEARIKEEKRKKEEEEEKERKRLEELQRKEEIERKRQEWLASPEYKAEKEKQKNTLIKTFIGLLILIPTILIVGYFSKNNNKSQPNPVINPELLDNNNESQSNIYTTPKQTSPSN